MKHLLLLTALIAGTAPLCAQSTVIHQFKFSVAEELRTSQKVEDKSRNVLNGFSTTVALSPEQVDSIRTWAVRFASTELGEPVRICETRNMVYPYPGSFEAGLLGGLPLNTFKMALKFCEAATKFVEFNCEITGGGTTTVGEWSSVKPRIHLRMQVFDQEKNSQKDIEVTLKDFPRLHGRVSQRGSVETKRSQALSAEELVAMFQEALEALVAR